MRNIHRAGLRTLLCGLALAAAAPSGVGAEVVYPTFPLVTNDGAPVTKTMRCSGFLGIPYDAPVVTARVGQQKALTIAGTQVQSEPERGYPWWARVSIDMGDFCAADAAAYAEIFLPPNTGFAAEPRFRCRYQAPGASSWTDVTADPAFNCPRSAPAGREGRSLGERRLPKNSKFTIEFMLTSSTTLSNVELKALVDSERIGSYAYPTVLANVYEFPPATGIVLIDGATKAGSTISCDVNWSRFPDSTEYVWQRATSNGWVDVGSDVDYTIPDDGNGAQFRCGSRAHNAAGWSDWAYTVPFGIDGFVPPVNTDPPRVAGSAVEGQTVTCEPGQRRLASSYAYEWVRDGGRVGTGQTRTLTHDDVGKEIRCAVAATGPGGNANALSDAVTPRAKPTATPSPVVTNPPKPEPPKPEPPKPGPPAPPTGPQQPQPQPPVTPQQPQQPPHVDEPKRPASSKAGKCSKLKGKKRAACVKKACGKKKGAKKRKCVKEVTRRGRKS